MTQQELARRQGEFEHDKWRRLLPRWLALLLPAVFLPLGLGVCLRERGAPGWAAITAGLVGIAGVPLWAWCGDVMIGRLRRLHGVECPHCGKALVAPTGALTLNGRRCGGCGTTLVADAH